MNENLRQNTVLMNASLFKFNSLRVGGKLYYISLRSQEEKSGLQQLVARQNVARHDWDGDVTWRRLCSLMQWRRYSACPSGERVATAPLERFSSIIRAHLLVVGCWAGVNSSDVYPSHCFFFPRGTVSWCYLPPVLPGTLELVPQRSVNQEKRINLHKSALLQGKEK